MSRREYRERFRKTAAEPGDVESGVTYINQLVKRGLVGRNDVEIAALLGNEAAAGFLERPVQKFDSVADWANEIARVGGPVVRAREARAIIRSIIQADNKLQDQGDQAQWVEPIKLYNAYIDSPTEENAQLFVDSAANSLGAIPFSSMSGQPTGNFGPTYMLMLHNIVYPETKGNEQEVSAEEALSQLIEYSMNDEFGSGFSEDQVRQIITNDISEGLLDPREQ